MKKLYQKKVNLDLIEDLEDDDFKKGDNILTFLIVICFIMILFVFGLLFYNIYFTIKFDTSMDKLDESHIVKLNKFISIDLDDYVNDLDKYDTFDKIFIRSKDYQFEIDGINYDTYPLKYGFWLYIVSNTKEVLTSNMDVINDVVDNENITCLYSPEYSVGGKKCMFKLNDENFSKYNEGLEYILKVDGNSAKIINSNKMGEIVLYENCKLMRK